MVGFVFELLFLIYIATIVCFVLNYVVAAAIGIFWICAICSVLLIWMFIESARKG